MVKHHLSLPVCIPFEINPDAFDIAIDCKGLLELTVIILGRYDESSTSEHKKHPIGSEHFHFLLLAVSLSMRWKSFEDDRLENLVITEIFCFFSLGYQALNSREISTVISNNCTLKPQGISFPKDSTHKSIYFYGLYELD